MRAFNLFPMKGRVRWMRVSALAISLSLIVASSWASVALASDKANGTFTAQRACDAFLSFNKGTNPGGVQLTAGAEYQVVEVNKKDDWTWIRVRVPDAQPEERWVPRDCGIAGVTFGESGGNNSGTNSGNNNGSGGNQCHTPNLADSYVLAMSWQAGFCEHTPAGKTKPECQAMERGELVVNHFTLHGLWPNKDSCGTNYNACGNQGLDLTDETIAQVAPWMPNFRYGTSFGSYEWQKHGTCQALDDDTYFLLAVGMVERMQACIIGRYVVDHLGSSFSTEEFFETMETELGQDAAARIRLRCGGGGYLQEVWLQLPKTFDDQTSVKDLLTGPKVSRSQRASGCGSSVKVEASGH